jgi:hypothetical protein
MRESLYTGIELPAEWPPKNMEPSEPALGRPEARRWGEVFTPPDGATSARASSAIR